jgi:hypothetical protein
MIGLVITPEYITGDWCWEALLVAVAWLITTGATDVTVEQQGNEEYVLVGDDVVCYREVDDEEA